MIMDIDPRIIAISTFLELFKAVTERKSSNCYTKDEPSCKQHEGSNNMKHCNVSYCSNVVLAQHSPYNNDYHCSNIAQARCSSYNKCLCISTSQTSRTYIGFSYVLSDSVILCEVNDIYPRLNKSLIVHSLTIIEYIQNLSNIVSITCISDEIKNVNHEPLTESSSVCSSHSETNDWM
jgi:hypothetical protein